MNDRVVKLQGIAVAIVVTIVVAICRPTLDIYGVNTPIIVHQHEHASHPKIIHRYKSSLFGHQIRLVAITIHFFA